MQEARNAWHASGATPEIGDPFATDIGVDDWLDPMSFGEEDVGAFGDCGLGSAGLGISGDEANHAGASNQLGELDFFAEGPHISSVRASAMRASYSMNDLMAHSGQPLAMPGLWNRKVGAAGSSSLEPVPEGSPAPGPGMMAPSSTHSMYELPPTAAGLHQNQQQQQQQPPRHHQQLMLPPPAGFMEGQLSYPGPAHAGSSLAVATSGQPAHRLCHPAEVQLSVEEVPGPSNRVDSLPQQGGHAATAGAFGLRQPPKPLQLLGLPNIQAQHGEMSGGMRKSHSALELGAWRQVAAGELDAFVDAGTREQLQGMGALGNLTPAERLQKILRYRAKRQLRNFNRTIKYQCRKSLADTRPRVRGRFARDNEPGSVMPHETKKALREKGASSGGGGANSCGADDNGGTSGGADVKMEVAEEPSGSATSAGTSAQMQHDVGTGQVNTAAFAQLFNEWAEPDDVGGRTKCM